MDRTTKNKLDRLLAGDGLSGPEADAIFDRVYESVRSDERRPLSWRRRALLAGGGLAAAAALVLLLARPGTQPANGLAARGDAAATVELQVVCSDGTLGACPKSAKLVFLVSGDRTDGFLSAYAEPLDRESERVWYFSRETESPALAAAAEGTRVFQQAVRLDDSHRAGRYRVHAYLSDRALGRRELLDPASVSGIRASMHAELTIRGD